MATAADASCPRLQDVAQTELVPYGEPFQLPCSDAEVLHACVQAILSRLDEAMRPAIISDAGVVWHHAEQEVRDEEAGSLMPDSPCK
jgi:thiamine pyrophosphate-dependent acetolactate synthase large subunit-like protein